jgi:hypothetical protein
MANLGTMPREMLQKRLDENEKEYASIINDAMGWYFTDHGHTPQELVKASDRYVESRMWLERFLNSEHF